MYDPDLAVGTPLERLLTEVGSEVMRAQAKWPPIHNLHEGWGVIMEEVSEYTDACREQLPNRNAARVELIHIAAMAVRVILDVTDAAN